jgi:hypothetical protein
VRKDAPADRFCAPRGRILIRFKAAGHFSYFSIAMTIAKMAITAVPIAAMIRVFKDF